MSYSIVDKKYPNAIYATGIPALMFARAMVVGLGLDVIIRDEEGNEYECANQD